MCESPAMMWRLSEDAAAAEKKVRPIGAGSWIPLQIASRIDPFRLDAPTRAHGVHRESPKAFFGDCKVQVVRMLAMGRKLRWLLDGRCERITEGERRYVGYLD